jgi:hypothetical protein
MASIAASAEKADLNNIIDVEKNAPSSDSDVVIAQSESFSLGGKSSWWKKFVSWGIEEGGVVPIPVEQRTNDQFVNIFSLWFTISISTLP